MKHISYLLAALLQLYVALQVLHNYEKLGDSQGKLLGVRLLLNRIFSYLFILLFFFLGFKNIFIYLLLLRTRTALFLVFVVVFLLNFLAGPLSIHKRRTGGDDGTSGAYVTLGTGIGFLAGILITFLVFLFIPGLGGKTPGPLLMKGGGVGALIGVGAGVWRIWKQK